jgi:hypothetical protein
MAILPKAIYMFNAIPIKIPMTFITEIKKSTLKFIWKHKRPWIAKAILSKKTNDGGITIPDFKLYYKAIAMKTSMVLAQKQTWRPVVKDRGTRYESTQLCPRNFWQRLQKHTMEKRQTLQEMLLGKVVCLQKKLKPNPCLSPCTSVNWKWIKDLNIRSEALKLVKEREGIFLK